MLHWGHDLGDLTADDLLDLALAGIPGTVPNDLDAPTPYGALLPEHSHGWNGRPGLAGSRSGPGWSPRFAPTGFHATVHPIGGGRVVATGHDEAAGLDVTLEVELLPSGLVRQRASVTSTQDGEYQVRGLALTLPVPPAATEVFDLAARWGRERSPQRKPFVVGVRRLQPRPRRDRGLRWRRAAVDRRRHPVLAVGLRPAARLSAVRRQLRRPEPGPVGRHLPVRLGRLLVQAHIRVHRRHRAGRVHRHLSKFAQFVDLQVIRPLDDFPATANIQDSDYQEGLAELWKGQYGKRYGAPKDWDTIAIFYSKQALRDAGIDEASLRAGRTGPLCSCAAGESGA